MIEYSYEYNTLACAYAECCQFEKASSVQEKVIVLVAVAKADTRDFIKRLDLYKSKKPYRQ